jgi:general secretion pathway protein N
MMRGEMMRKFATRLALLLAGALSVPASTSALPSDASDLDAGTAPRRADTPATPSLWDSPAASAPTEVGPAEPKRPEARRVPSANPLWAIPLVTLSNTRERPIFSPTRRPPPPAVAPVSIAKASSPPKPPQAEHPQLSLVGTIAGSDQSIGIFVDQTSKAALRLKLGEDYQGWKLRAVQGREVTLERDERTAILSLPQPGTVTPAPVRMQAENATAQTAVDAISQRGSRR